MKARRTHGIVPYNPHDMDVLLDANRNVSGLRKFREGQQTLIEES